MAEESPLFWPARLEDKTLFVLDETLLPQKLHYIKVKNVLEAVKVIRDMKTRAFGQFLVVVSAFLLVLKNSEKKTQAQIFSELKKSAQALNKSRPTFPFSEVTGMVLGWAQADLAQNMDLRVSLLKKLEGFLYGIRGRRMERVQKLAEALKKHSNILTHCNVSGELAMAAAICKAQGKVVKVFSTETRPYFQGARLTCWEMQQAGIDVTLIADNAVGMVLSQGLVDAVVFGSDRSCANGDVANKIGTYQIAVVAKEFGIPVYVLTQPSKGVAAGKDIPIEIRDENELLVFKGKRIAPKRVKGFYPGFDVLPYELITETIPINVN
jgi:methylthioribose-1-phosphate isomerase